LTNWPATRGTVETLTDPGGFGMSPRRITISTVGIVPGILRLAEAGSGVRLAVSLHSADDAVRRRLVPANALYGLGDVLAACREYQRRAGQRVTFEYVLIDGVNDRLADARSLALRLRGLRAHVNVIPLNPTSGTGLRASRRDVAESFQAALRSAGVPTTLRLGRGVGIRAGCGQLRSRAQTGRVGRSIAGLEARQPSVCGGPNGT
jgi:23S rRNA (adenine2503-C2)-methyltransferase